MEKTKLIKTRVSKGLTQNQVANHLCMDVSNYNRKEKGKLKILPHEWEKLSGLLGVSVDEIFEPEDNNHFVFKDSAVGNYVGTNHFYTIPEYLLENQRKYTDIIVNDNKEKEQEILTLKNEIHEKDLLITQLQTQLQQKS